MTNFGKTIMLSMLLTSLLAVSATAFQDIDRTKRPQGGPAPKINLPQIQKATLANGLQIWLVERHELPTVALNLVIQAGADHDPLDKPGIASMTADVMDEGTKTRDALTISDELESVGANLSITSGLDGSNVSIGVLSKYMGKALDIYTDVLTNPTFPQKEFDRLKKQRLTALKQQHDQATAIANNAFSSILYGSSHPYGNNPMGTEASVNAITRDDLMKFYESFYRPNNATLIVVGDVKMKDLKAKLEKPLASWKTSGIPGYSLPPVKPVRERRVFLIDKPKAPQSEVRIGYPALARSTPDYFTVTVMNRVLGGQFSSRINLNIREKHGWTYGARSGFSFQKAPGPFSASGGIVTEATDSSLTQFLYEIDLMHEKGLTPEELAFAKKGLIGSFALTFETPAQIARGLQDILVYGLPEDYYVNYLQNIDAVKLEDVQAAAKKYLDTSAMDVLVVGDLAKVRAGVEALKLGPVVLCDLDGKPIQ